MFIRLEKKFKLPRRLLAFLLCLCIVMSTVGGVGIMTAFAAYFGPTQNIVKESRIADPNTMESYSKRLLTDETGSRYAGRVWTDKTVFANGAADEKGGVADNKIGLEMNFDGYKGNVGFNADFAHVFSALASSQVVNEWPPAPIDLVIALDMSASMAQDTRYAINVFSDETDSNTYRDSVPVEERTMAARIKNSRIQKTLDAVNGTIDALMKQNKENRVSVVVYGAGAVVLLPLAHYARVGEQPYLSVGGMETLYRPDDLTVDSTYGWVWTRNIDACYTVVANAMKSEDDNPTFAGDPFKNSVSNNIDNSKPKSAVVDDKTYTEKVIANPGYATWESVDPTEDAFSEDHQELKADTYVGYYTNTQGGIYLAYAQLARSKKTTFTAKMSTGEPVTVARIPAAIIMSDGGANFAFNEMDNWSEFYGDFGSKYFGDWKASPYFRDDDAGDNTDYSHRLGQEGVQIGDEWYNVYLPGVEDGNKITSLYNEGALVDEDGMILGDYTLSTAPAWNHAGIFYSNDGDPFGTSGTVLETLLTAAYMRHVTETHYENGWDAGSATKESRSDLLTYTMSVDSKNVPQWGRMRLYPSLNPKEYSLDSDNEWWKNEAIFGSEDIGHGPDSYNKTAVYNGLKSSWQSWKNRNSGTDANFAGTHRGYIEPLPTDGYTDSRFDNIKVTNQDVINNISYADDFYDIDTSEVVARFQEILSEITGSVFIPISGDNDAGVGDSITYQDPLGEYMELKNGAITVDGTVTDSSEKTFDMSLLLFGEMHGIVRAGVYDYQWNNDYMRKNETKDGYTGKKLDPDKDPLPIGWYKGDALTAVYSYNAKGLPDGCDTAADAWANGWVLRFNYITLAEFVPISGIDTDTPPTDVPEQIQHSVYTCYRFADSQKERNKLRRNPIYGDTIPDDLVKKWDAYFNEHDSYPVGMDFYSAYPGVYRLSDIRVWSEHTGDFIDTTGAITPEESSGYDDSLYINIPTAAVPTQLAEITLGADGPISYKDNLGIKAQSTPIRLFYSVGLTEDLILRDSDGNQTGVDVSKISGEYIASHSDPTTDNIYFISNWYSNTVYRGYASDDSSYGYSTRGDAAVSFSPSVENRYYLFQKPLPLIAHAYRVLNDTGEVAPVDGPADMKWEDNNGAGNGSTTWETVGDTPQSASSWIGGEFIGTYDSDKSFKDKLEKARNNEEVIGGVQYIRDDKGYAYPLPKNITDAIITYTKDQLSKVDSNDSGGYTEGSNSFSSDDYFFLCIEYYLPMEGTGKDINGNDVKGTRAVRKVNHMIARKGSAFGSGLASNNINNGDMLCWTDINGKCNLEIEYNSHTDTGDNTRGRPTLEKLTLQGDKLRTYLRDECGLNAENNVEVRDPDTGEVTSHTSYLELDVAYWLSVQADPHMAELIEQIEAAGNQQAQQEAFNNLFDWSVAARTGGIRVGDMFNNVQPKGDNTEIPAGSTYYKGNLTQTANNYYVPTLSETSTAGNGMVINNYLGNNGRMEIANVNLMATKTLVAPDGFTLSDDQQDEEFDYQVFEQEMVGERLAQRLKWNPFSKSWQKRVESLDILTDNSSLLLDTNGNRALFCCTDGQTPKQVVAVVENENGETKTKYYYADESGAATADECAEGLENLYYMYLPSNESGDSNLTYHLFGSKYEGYKDVDGKDIGTTEKIDGAGTTAYYPKGMSTEGMADNDMQHFAQAREGREAGSREYWTTKAELIPYQNVYDAEHPADSIDSGSAEIAVIALEADTGSTRWDHATDHAKDDHKPLNQFTLVTVIPDKNSVDSTVYSPFSSRTTYMTVPLYFGYKATLAEHLKICDGGGSLANCTHANETYKLTQDDLFDKDLGGLPPEASGATNFVTQHTANFTLKSGEGLLLTGLGNDAYYRFTEKLTDTQREQAYVLQGIKQVTMGGETNETPSNLNTGVYSVSGTTDYFTEQNHYTNTIDPELFVLTKSMEDINGNKVEVAPDEEFTFTVTFKPTDDAKMTDVDDTLHYWKGNKDYTSTRKWKDGGTEYQMPHQAPGLDEYEKYLTSEAGGERLATIEPDGGKGNTYTVHLKANETIVFYGLIAGTEYTVTETKNEKYPVVADGGASEGGYTKTGTIKRASADPLEINPKTTDNREEFINLLETGILTVEKRIKGDEPDTEKDFGFTVTLTPAPETELKLEDLEVTKYKADGTAYDASAFTISWNPEDGGQKAEVTLKHGEKLLIEGIPIGTTYKVKESQKDGYNLQHVADNAADSPGVDDNYLPLTGNSVTGTITTDKAQAYLLFVNEKAPFLPFVGGMGVVAIVLIGVLLIGLATALIVQKKNRRRRNA